MSRITYLTLVGLAFGASGALAQERTIEAELDAFWADVVGSVENWDLNAQQATYHPDAVSVSGDEESYATRLMSDVFPEVENTSTPPSNPRLAFRFSSRIHDANTAHELGLYRYTADGREPFIGAVDSYLVRKDGRWMILLEIQRREGLSEAEWNALGG